MATPTPEKPKAADTTTHTPPTGRLDPNRNAAEALSGPLAHTEGAPKTPQEVESQYKSSKKKFEEQRSQLQDLEGDNNLHNNDLYSDFDNSISIQREKVEENRGELARATKERNTRYIQEIIEKKTFASIDDEAKKIVYGQLLAGIKYENILGSEEKSKAVREKLKSDSEFNKLTDEQKTKKVQELVIQDEIRAGVNDLTKFFTLASDDSTRETEIKKLSSKLQQLGIQNPDKLLQEAFIKQKIAENIARDGMLASGVGFESVLGREIVKRGRLDYRDTVNIFGDNTSLDDLPINIRLNLLFNEKFLEQNENMPARINREIQNLRNEFRKREGEQDDARIQRIDNAIQSVGLSRTHIERSARNSVRSQLSPLIRFLADLFAPIGALFGGEIGKFWRDYLSDSGSTSGGGALGHIDDGPLGTTINAQHSSNHRTNVDNYLRGARDSAYDGKVNNTASRIEKYENRYKEVSQRLRDKYKKNIPWQVIGAIHEREGSLDFNTYLHNGDRLGRPTTHVPRGINFDNWEDAAVDALNRETYVNGMDINTKDGLAAIAEYCERFNGLGYRKKGRVSPYIWSGASFYTGGRYVRDGVFSASSKDSRPGTMPVIIALAKKQEGFQNFQESTSQLSSNRAVQWFQNNGGAPYGSGEGRYDCMTSTHAALELNPDRDLNADIFRRSNILRDGVSSDLWNVSMAAARYSGALKNINSPTSGISFAKGYYGGERAEHPENMEYYIEENVMERVNHSPTGIIDVSDKHTLIHYSKKNGIEKIVNDIKERLKNNGESAMMGATGNGTNKGGHEWLVANEGGKLMVYDATNYGHQGVSGSGTELSEYLKHNRRAKYENEAIIFAKKGE